jgi:osomolarity two-component system response regulator SKN7
MMDAWTPDTPNGSARTSLRFMVDPMPSNVGGASVVPLEDSSMDASTSASVGVAPNGNTTSTGGGASEADSSAQQPAAQGSASTSNTNANGTPLSQMARRPMKPSWTHSPRILVVEDDVVYRQLSSKFLEKFGCVVETAEHAQQGIEKMNKTKYDLVLMDIFFGPSMDGRTATSLIRQFDMMTPIISMTSNVQTSE